jgi:hypothetical protein
MSDRKKISATNKQTNTKNRNELNCHQQREVDKIYRAHNTWAYSYADVSQFYADNMNTNLRVFQDFLHGGGGGAKISSNGPCVMCVHKAITFSM